MDTPWLSEDDKNRDRYTAVRDVLSAFQTFRKHLLKSGVNDGHIIGIALDERRITFS